MKQQTLSYLFGAILASLVAVANCQCSTDGFDFSGTELISPLDIITFDNINSTGWTSGSGVAYRVTPADQIEVLISGNVIAGSNFARVTSGWTPLSSNWATSWNKPDIYASSQAYGNYIALDFSTPIRQFSMKISHSNTCVPSGWIPRIALSNATGALVTCMDFNISPSVGSVNEYRILRYRGAEANVQRIVLSTCTFAFDDLAYKVAPCSPNPCNATLEEVCFEGPLDAICCPRNTTWNGTECISKRLF